jgi:hypothetical protein
MPTEGAKMPTIPVAGQPRKVTIITQPPVEDVRPAVISSTSTGEIKEVPEPTPEPALTAADHIPPTQDELAALSVATQNIAKRNAMTPGEAPAYKFTVVDREKASEARWSKRYDWEHSNLDDALAYLAEIRAECERGGLLLQGRISELKVERVKCFGCDNIINLSEGRWATMRTRNNFETGVPESAYACSAACGLKLNREFTHPVAIRQPVER